MLQIRRKWSTCEDIPRIIESRLRQALERQKSVLIALERQIRLLVDALAIPDDSISWLHPELARASTLQVLAHDCELHPEDLGNAEKDEEVLEDGKGQGIVD